MAVLGFFPTHIAADAAFDAWYVHERALRHGASSLCRSNCHIRLMNVVSIPTGPPRPFRLRRGRLVQGGRCEVSSPAGPQPPFRRRRCDDRGYKSAVSSPAGPQPPFRPQVYFTDPYWQIGFNPSRAAAPLSTKMPPCQTCGVNMFQALPGFSHPFDDVVT